jgi:hypothetical protein
MTLAFQDGHVIFPGQDGRVNADRQGFGDDARVWLKCETPVTLEKAEI